MAAARPGYMNQSLAEHDNHTISYFVIASLTWPPGNIRLAVALATTIFDILLPLRRYVIRYSTIYVPNVLNMGIAVRIFSAIMCSSGNKCVLPIWLPTSWIYDFWFLQMELSTIEHWYWVQHCFIRESVVLVQHMVNGRQQVESTDHNRIFTILQINTWKLNI